MIIFFGPAGAGKSMQGQLLVVRQDWRWLSAGQLLRDTHDNEVLEAQKSGELVDSNKVNQIIGDAIKRSADISKVILDGFPRRLEQARWLIERQSDHGKIVDLAIVLDVPRDELMKRLNLRGRVDDAPETIDDRLKIYQDEVNPILNYFTEQGIKVVHIDGSGSVGQVHDKIVEELKSCDLI